MRTAGLGCCRSCKASPPATSNSMVPVRSRETIRWRRVCGTEHKKAPAGRSSHFELAPQAGNVRHHHREHSLTRRIRGTTVLCSTPDSRPKPPRRGPHCSAGCTVASAADVTRSALTLPHGCSLEPPSHSGMQAHYLRAMLRLPHAQKGNGRGRLKATAYHASARGQCTHSTLGPTAKADGIFRSNAPN